MKSTKCPKNKAESEFYQNAQTEGWNITKRGWPDFFCEKDGKIMLVEVKRKASNKMKLSQIIVMGLLGKYGVPCYRWDLEDKKLYKIENKYLK